MSDFQSREEELLKLNDELDRKTQSALEENYDSSGPTSPITGSVVSSRRPSVEINKINLKANSVSTVTNSSLDQSASRSRKSKNPPNSRLLSSSSKEDNDSRTSSRYEASSRIPSPKSDNRSISSKNSEKLPPFKAKVWTAKAYTIPRKARDVANSPSKRTIAKEKELIKINAKIDKKAKSALEDAKENIEKPKVIVNERPPSRYAYRNTRSPKNIPSPRNTQSPRNVQSPRIVLSPRSVQSPRKATTPDKSSHESNVKTSSSLPKKAAKIMTETYRNKNFKESPSTEALNLQLNQFPSETKDNLTGKSEQTSKTKRESATSSIKKPLRQLPGTAEKVNRKTVSTDGLIKYLKSKLSIIEMELEDNMNELRKKTDELHASYETQKKLEMQRDQVILKNNALTEQLSKMEEKLQSLERKLHDREFDHSATTREVETLRREVRVITQANNNLEKRLYKANEEMENMRNIMTSLREADRDKKEAGRQEREAQEKQIKTLKKQRSELLNAYKKQLYLIDNLRRQNICMEQAKMLSFGEKEFTKVLGWNAQN